MERLTRSATKNIMFYISAEHVPFLFYHRRLYTLCCVASLLGQFENNFP